MKRRMEMIIAFDTLYRYVNRKFKREFSQQFNDRISNSEYLYLRSLHDKGAQMVSALSVEFSVSPSHITAVMNRLAKKEYVRRIRSDDDRRVVKLALTKKGEALVAELTERLYVFWLEKMKVLTTQEMEELLRIYRKLAL
jgi:DNA-binding MarR family transcriptional regulator